jgi:hypothetical protein
MKPVRNTMLELRLEPRSRRTIVRFAVVALAALVLLAAAAPWNPPALSAPNYTLKLIAGSYGPFGSNQLLLVDSLGNVSYYHSVLTAPGGDSTFTVLGPAQRQALYDTLTAVNFFGLSPLYDGNAFDGDGIVIRVQTGSTTNTVQAMNIAVSAVNRIARTINALLAPAGIVLHYNTIND